ncbi:MAG: UDP-N-acetylmuramate dehydrogenase [Bacteroidaceae bacterium]|nr:UDP-N-acetylmuramate dehydrogenase [Bacteroidaceae bacterium]
MNIKENEPLLDHNTFAVEATARYYAEYKSVNELKAILTWRKEFHPSLPILNIGEGSNLLFTRPTFEGLVIKAAEEIAFPFMTADDCRVEVWAGTKMDRFIQWSLDNGYHGLENLSWIPGTVGASAVQNIGAYGAEAGTYIEAVRCVHCESMMERVFSHDECEYAYRDSIFKHHRQWIVTHVSYRLTDTFTPNLQYGNLAKEFAGKTPSAHDVRNAVISARKGKLPDPAQQGNAGSFFMNPIVSQATYEAIAKEFPTAPHYPTPDNSVKLSAAWLIEQCGWKGRSLGKAAVSDRHSLILVNLGGASGAEIVALCHAVQDAVKERFGVELRPEVNFL